MAPPKFDWNPHNYLFESRGPFSEIETYTPLAEDFYAPPPVTGSLLANYNFLPQSASMPTTQANMAAQIPKSHESHASVPIAQAAIASQILSAALEGHTNISVEDTQPPKATTADTRTPSVHQPIKISPPSQFDHSRPFVLNGQMVYPLPGGFQPPPNSVPLPITVLGDSNLQHQVPTNGSFLSPPYPVPMPLPLMMPQGPGGHHPMMFPNGGPHLEGGFPLTPYMPQFAPGLISLSELTKSQIQGIRNQVKHIDNQLLNEKRQVDETFLQRQRSELMGFIEKMETMLQTQLGQETNHASMLHLNGKTGDKTIMSNRVGSTETLRMAAIETENKKPIRSRLFAESAEELGEKNIAIAPPIPLFVPASQQPASHTQSEGPKAAIESKPSTRPEPVPNSRLTVAAAKAPPFQPRAHTMGNLSHSGSVGDTSGQKLRDSVALPNPALTAPQCEAPDHQSAANLSSEIGHLIPHSGEAYPTLSQVQSMQASQIFDGNQSALFQRAHTFRASLSGYDGVSKPYLIGTLPSGMHLGEGSEFLYSRPLTQDEVRARHLYWGDAPRSVLKGSGLPKFDGKDFYPPSPVKGMARLATKSGAHKPSTPASLAFESLFTNPQLPGYHTPPQLRTKANEQNIVSTPIRALLQGDIIGFQSPSPRPATYTFDSRLPQNWSATYNSDNEGSNNSQIAQSTNSANPIPEDFSTLFAFTSAPQHHSTPFAAAGDFQPSTPQSEVCGGLDERKDEEPASVDSWGAPKNGKENAYEDIVDLTSIKTNTNDSQDSSSTVEIRLSPNTKITSPKRASGTVSAKRQDNLYG